MEESRESFHQQEDGNCEHSPDGPRTEHEDPTQLVDAVAVHRHRHLYEEVPQHLGQL